MKKIFFAAAVISAAVWSCKSSVTDSVVNTPATLYVYFNAWSSGGSASSQVVSRIGYDGVGRRVVAKSAYICTAPAQDYIVMLGFDSTMSTPMIFIEQGSQLNSNSVVIRKIALPTIMSAITWGHPVLSDDGMHIALVGYYPIHSDSSALYWMDINGENGWLSTINAAYETLPAFSHDGTRIAFFGYDHAVHTMKLDGTNPHTFGSYSHIDNDYMTAMQWSPADDRLMYATTQGHCYTANPDGSNVVDLSATVLMSLPALSHIGNKIAYTAGGINIANTDGTGVEVITPTTASQLDAFPAWSADGTKIVFTSYAVVGGSFDMDHDPGTLNIVDVASKTVSKLADSVSKQAYWPR